VLGAVDFGPTKAGFTSVPDFADVAEQPEDAHDLFLEIILDSHFVLENVAPQVEPRILPPKSPLRHPASTELAPNATAKTKTDRNFIKHSFEKNKHQWLRSHKDIIHEK